MSELEINIIGVKTQIKIKNIDEKDLYTESINELNLECNNIVMGCGNIDKTILLFYLLLKNSNSLMMSKNKNDLILENIKKISKFIEEKNNDKVKFEDQINKIRENLVVINIITKVKYKKSGGEQGGSDSSGLYDDEEFNQVIDKFVNDVKNDIEIAKNELFLL